MDDTSTDDKLEDLVETIEENGLKNTIKIIIDLFSRNKYDGDVISILEKF